MTLKEAIMDLPDTIHLDVGTKGNRKTGISKRGKYVTLVINRNDKGFEISEAISKGYDDVSRWILDHYGTLTDLDIEYIDTFVSSQPCHQIYYQAKKK